MTEQQTHYHRGSGWALCGAPVAATQQETITCAPCLDLLRQVQLMQLAGTGASVDVLHQLVITQKTARAAVKGRALTADVLEGER
jgi:hypothetical protein